MEKLGNEDVHLQDVCDVILLDFPEDVDEPLELAVRRTNPQEVHLGVRGGTGG